MSQCIKRLISDISAIIDDYISLNLCNPSNAGIEAHSHPSHSCHMISPQISILDAPLIHNRTNSHHIASPSSFESPPPKSSRSINCNLSFPALISLPTTRLHHFAETSIPPRSSLEECPSCLTRSPRRTLAMRPYVHTSPNTHTLLPMKTIDNPPRRATRSASPSPPARSPSSKRSAPKSSSAPRARSSAPRAPSACPPRRSRSPPARPPAVRVPRRGIASRCASTSA